jgi:radical SAM protein with 4Fe4S-binding SPASM domain
MKNSESDERFETRPLPKTFVLELTRRCNHRCQYCYTAWNAPALDYDPAGTEEMSAQEIVRVVGKLRDETPVQSIALSGGEPLLRDDLPEIIAGIDALGIASVVITNGRLLTEEQVAATANRCAYEVTLLSFRREVHDQLAGRNGAWDAALKGMANVRQAGGTLVAVFVASRFNYMDLFKTAELAIALGAYGLMYNRLNLGAYNIRYADQLLPTPAMIRENLDTLEELGAMYGLPISVSVVIEPCVVDVRKYKNIHFGWCPQAGQDAYFTIDPVGNIRVCNHSPVVLGNIRQDRFTEIYYTHPHVRNYYETWPIECADCEPELKELCRGGCRAAAEQCYGTIERVDPFVTMSRISEMR